MARNRQRAKERKERLHRENVPGELQHTGDVDEAEASIVAGAGGDPAGVDDRELEEQALGSQVPADVELELDEAKADGGGGRGGNGGTAVARSVGEPPGEPTKGRALPRFAAFLRACWAELQRVQWPDRRQVGQATAVVLGFVVVAGLFLGLADYVAEEIVDFIL